MTIATSAVAGEDRSSRWILLASLALNLFFVGASGALMARHYLFDSATVRTSPVDRSVAARVERLAATLPSADAGVLRAEYRANATTVDASREAYYRAQDEVRRTLRSEPFEPEAMRAAMVKTRAARQTFDQLLQDLIASAAAKMSPAGRNQLANWPPSRRGTSGANR